MQNHQLVKSILVLGVVLMIVMIMVKMLAAMVMVVDASKYHEF